MSESRVGRFVLVRPVRKGGLGLLSIAWDTEKLQLVALKRAGGKLGDAAARFAEERQLTQRLSHVNLVRALDAGDHDGVGWLELELVDGQDLESLLDRARKYDQRLPLPVAGAIVRQVLAALEYAHAQSVVHRDVSPRNVMVGYNGVVHLVDFGLALSEVKSTRTLPGIAPGTAGFLAPEQRLGKPEAASDLYAVGALFWFALTGAPFFGEGEEANTKEQFRNRLSGLAGDLPPLLGTFLWRTLQKSPSERYASAREMGAALEEALGTPLAPQAAVGALVANLFPVEKKMAADEAAGCRTRYSPRSTLVMERNPPPRRRWPLWVGGGAALLLLGEVGWIFYLRLQPPPLSPEIAFEPATPKKPVVTPLTMPAAPVEPAMVHVKPSHPAARTPHPWTPSPSMPAEAAPSAPSSPAHIEAARTLVGRAETKLHEGDYSAAIALSSQAIALGADENAYIVRGVALLRSSGGAADAARDFQRVLAIDPGNATAQAALKSIQEHK